MSSGDGCWVLGVGCELSDRRGNRVSTTSR